jgi:hypothetical protein
MSRVGLVAVSGVRVVYEDFIADSSRAALMTPFSSKGKIV